MRSSKILLLLGILVAFNGAARKLQVTGEATVTATLPAIDCNAPLASPTAASTYTATPEAAPTSLATQQATDPIKFVSFLPTDIRFNPDPQKPVALVIVFSLIFQNQLNTALHIEHPRFRLAIDDVPWGDLSSTDFQTGDMPAQAQQGIVLQSLTLINNTTPAQQAVLPCLKTGDPVDLTLTGTMDAFPNGTKQGVGVRLISPQVIIRAHTAVGQSR